MILVYRLLINLILIFSPLIILIRILKKKNTSKDLRKNLHSFLRKEKKEI